MSASTNTAAKTATIGSAVNSVDQKIGGYWSVISLVIRLVQIVLAGCVMICLHSAGGGFNFLWFAGALTICTILIVHSYEILHSTTGIVGTSRWYSMLCFVNTVVCLTYLVGSSLISDNAHNARPLIIMAGAKQYNSLISAAVFGFITFIFYLLASGVYFVRWWQASHGPGNPRNAPASVPEEPTYEDA